LKPVIHAKSLDSMIASEAPEEQEQTSASALLKETSF
jgi:hypothetical protein